MKKSFIMLAVSLLFANIGCAEELSLEESISLALEKNENIAAQDAAKKASRHQLSATRRAAGLNIGWSGGAKRIGGAYYKSARSQYNPGSYNVWSDTYIKSNDPYRNEFANSITARFPIYTGGQLEGNMKSAGFQSASADLNLEKVRQDVRFQTQQAYYDLLQRNNLLRVAENAVKTAKQQLNIINIQYEEGALPKADVLQMQVQLAAYNQELVTAQGSLDVAMYQLARLVGKEGETLVLKDKLSYKPFPYTLTEAETFAMENRPDRAAATFAINQAKAQLMTAKSGYKPKVSATYTRNIIDNRPFMRDGRSETWAAGLDMSWSVFDNFVTSANVDAANENIKRAKANEENVKKTLILETRSAYRQMKSAEANISAAKIAMEQAKESFEIASVRYEEGVDNLLSVTTAQERLTRAEVNYYTALYNYNLYQAQLERAMGYPVVIDVPTYEKGINNNPGSAGHIDKIEESAKIYR